MIATCACATPDSKAEVKTASKKNKNKRVRYAKSGVRHMGEMGAVTVGLTSAAPPLGPLVERLHTQLGVRVDGHLVLRIEPLQRVDQRR